MHYYTLEYLPGALTIENNWFLNALLKILTHTIDHVFRGALIISLNTIYG